jgi:hypothetical protein
MEKQKIRPSFAVITAAVTIIVAVALKITYAHFAVVLPQERQAVPLAKFDTADLVTDIGKRMVYMSQRARNVSFRIYKIKMKENLWTIGKRYGFSVHTVIGCNPQLKTYQVDNNQPVLLPSRPGCIHILQKGDDMGLIAKMYDIKPEEIEKYNPLISKMAPGEMLFIPDRRPDINRMNDAMRAKYELRSIFVWPLGGRFTSRFGKRIHPVTHELSFHGGVDIAVKEGTLVGAAADGVVTVASSGIGHYGTAVFIDHKNGFETEYGHLSKIFVRVGQKVKAHQLIARSGSTGRVTGPHLHFTIKKNGTALNPQTFLW